MRLPRLITARGRRFRLFRRRRRSRAAKLLALLMIRQLPSLIRLVVRTVRDPRVGFPMKALFAAVLLYVLMPYDLIPDVLGPLGLTDDVFLLGLAMNRLLAAAGPEVLLEHWDGDPHELGYFVGGVEEIGGILPRRVRRALRRFAERSWG